MKKVLFVMSMLLVATFANAQVTWNVKGGVGASTMRSPEFVGSTKSKVVWRIGLGLETPISNNFLFMPSIELANKGTEIEMEEPGYYKTNQELSVTYIQVPLLLAYRVPLGTQNLTFKAGPYLAYGVSCSLKGTDIVNGTPKSFSVDGFSNTGVKEFDAGVTVGVGYEYRRFELGAEYEYGFANIVDGGEIKVKNGAFYVTLGYKF